MNTSGFWVRANVLYDTARGLPRSRLQLLLLDLVFIARQKEKLAQTSVLLAVSAGAESEAIKKSYNGFVKSLFPSVDLDAEQEKKVAAIQKELEDLGKSQIVFDIPESVRGRGLQGFGTHVQDALSKNKSFTNKVRGERA